MITTAKIFADVARALDELHCILFKFCLHILNAHYLIDMKQKKDHRNWSITNRIVSPSILVTDGQIQTNFVHNSTLAQWVSSHLTSGRILNIPEANWKFVTVNGYVHQVPLLLFLTRVRFKTVCLTSTEDVEFSKKSHYIRPSYHIGLGPNNANLPPPPSSNQHEDSSDHSDDSNHNNSDRETSNQVDNNASQDADNDGLDNDNDENNQHDDHNNHDRLTDNEECSSHNDNNSQNNQDDANDALAGKHDEFVSPIFTAN